MAAKAKNGTALRGMRWAGALRRGPWRAGCALVLTLSPAAAGASTAERVFATVSPSVVVVRAANSQGSGVVVAPQVVATNCHVLGEAAQITVQRGRISHAATRLRSDHQRDLCLLQVPTLESPPVTLGEAGRLRLGATVYAVGAPEGLEVSLSAGLVSQLRAAAGAPLVQTTAPIPPGSLGWGLFDERGRLLGLTARIEGGQDGNFALPAEWVAAALARASSWRQCRNAPTVACLLAEAHDFAGVVRPSDDASRAHADIAQAQAQAGDIAGALATARGIADPFWRGTALASIARAQAWAGDITGALATARSIEDASQRSPALAAIAQAQAEAGDRQGAAQTFTEALAAARSIQEGTWSRASALQYIAEAQARAGERQGAAQTFTEALAAARSIENASDHARTLRDIAQAQARAGEIAAALAAARGIEHAGWQAAALAGITAAQAQAGDIPGALTTARSIEHAGWQAAALADIAAAQAQAGDIAGARATARSITDAGWRASALRDIAEAQAGAGDIAGGLATARSIENAPNRASALRGIAQAQAQAGDRQGAAQTFAQALATARGIAGASDRASALRGIAAAQAQAGDRHGAAQTFVQAVATARSIANASDRASALRDIAREQAEAGDIAGAVATIDEISDQAKRAEALAAVAEHLAQRR